MDFSDENLVKDLDNRDMEAFTAIYDQYVYSLRRFAIVLLNNKHDAEDVVADVFVKMWQMRDRLTTEKNIKAFLFISVRNACLSVLRREQVRMNNRPAELETAQDSDIPDEILIATELRNRIRDEIERLPPQCRTVLKMTIYEGKKTAEIAELLNISCQTVTNHKSRAFQLIRSGWKVLVAVILTLTTVSYFDAIAGLLTGRS